MLSEGFLNVFLNFRVRIDFNPQPTVSKAYIRKVYVKLRIIHRIIFSPRTIICLVAYPGNFGW